MSILLWKWCFKIVLGRQFLSWIKIFGGSLGGGGGIFGAWLDCM